MFIQIIWKCFTLAGAQLVENSPRIWEFMNRSPVATEIEHFAFRITSRFRFQKLSDKMITQLTKTWPIPLVNDVLITDCETYRDLCCTKNLTFHMK